MPYTTVINFTAGNALAAADLNSNFDNLDYLNSKINEQIQIGASSMVPHSTLPSTYGEYISGTNGYVIPVMDFADTGNYVIACAKFVLPSDYSASSTMTAKFYWTANSTSTNSIYIGADLTAFPADGSLNVTPGTVQYVADANKSTAYSLNISDATSAITIAGTASPGSLCLLRVTRYTQDASDTLAATVRLISVVLTYTRP